MTNILLVVNNLKFRKRVTKVLTRGGYNVSEVENSHQAISEFQQIKSFDLVLIDMALPGLSGVDLCAWIRARSDVH